MPLFSLRWNQSQSRNRLPHAAIDAPPLLLVMYSMTPSTVALGKMRLSSDPKHASSEEKVYSVDTREAAHKWEMMSESEEYKYS